jgi:hypothetical protein
MHPSIPAALAADFPPQRAVSSAAWQRGRMYWDCQSAKILKGTDARPFSFQHHADTDLQQQDRCASSGLKPS